MEWEPAESADRADRVHTERERWGGGRDPAWEWQGQMSAASAALVSILCTRTQTRWLTMAVPQPHTLSVLFCPFIYFLKLNKIRDLTQWCTTADLTAALLDWLSAVGGSIQSFSTCLSKLSYILGGCSNQTVNPSPSEIRFYYRTVWCDKPKKEKRKNNCYWWQSC